VDNHPQDFPQQEIHPLLTQKSHPICLTLLGVFFFISKNYTLVDDRQQVYKMILYKNY